MNETTQFRIQKCACGAEATGTMTLKDWARYLFLLGWRVDTVGRGANFRCPKCVGAK